MAERRKHTVPGVRKAVAVTQLSAALGAAATPAFYVGRFADPAEPAQIGSSVPGAPVTYFTSAGGIAISGDGGQREGFFASPPDAPVDPYPDRGVDIAAWHVRNAGRGPA